MMVVFGMIFKFMIQSPQQKRSIERKMLMDTFAKGEEVLTNSG
ncbi:preprotein translocase subunit YajC, partial [Salmonella enterica subsp. enterica serovar Enteritidis]